MITDRRATYCAQILSPLATAAVEYWESIRTEGKPDFVVVQRALDTPIVHVSIQVETTYRALAPHNYVVTVADGETIQPLSIEEGRIEIPCPTPTLEAAAHRGVDDPGEQCEEEDEIDERPPLQVDLLEVQEGKDAARGGEPQAGRDGQRSADGRWVGGRG